jgi:O-antigen ligase
MSFTLNKQNLYVGTLSLFVLTLPFQLVFNNLAILLMGIMSLFVFKPKEIVQQVRQNPLAIAWLVLFVLHLIGLTYTQNMSAGWKQVEYILSFALLPFFVAGTKKVSPSALKFVKHTFIIGMGIALLVCLVKASLFTWETGRWATFNPDNKVLENHFIYHRLSSQIGMHAVLLACYTTLALAFVLIELLNNWKKLTFKVRLWYSIMFLFFSINIYLLRSASISLAWMAILVIIVTFFIKRKYLKNLKIKHYLYISVLIVTIGVVGFQMISQKLNLADKKLTEIDFTAGPHTGQWNALNIRLAKWTCVWDVIEQNWLIGVGTGDVEVELVETYEKREFTIGIEKKYNPHNQYLHYAMALGIPGFLTYIFILLWMSWKAWKRQNITWLVFAVLIGLFSMTDSLLSVNKGIVFTIFFSLYFSYSGHTFVKKRKLTKSQTVINQ